MSYGFGTTWGRVNDDQFLFQLNYPIKGKFSRVELLYVLFQATSTFSNSSGVFPYHIVFALQQLCTVGDIWLDAPDSCPIWPLRLPNVPTNSSNSDYIIVCSPFLPLIQILTFFVLLLSASLSLCPPILLLNVWLQGIICLIGTLTFQQLITPPHTTIYSWIIFCYCDHLGLFQLPRSLEGALNETYQQKTKANQSIKKLPYWLYVEYAKRLDQNALWYIRTIIQYTVCYPFSFFPV